MDVTMRCSTVSLPEIDRLLPPRARDKVKQIGFKNMLSLPSIRMSSKKIIETLMDEQGLLMMKVRLYYI